MYNLSSEIQNRKYIPNKFYINMKEILRKRLGWKIPWDLIQGIFILK